MQTLRKKYKKKAEDLLLSVEALLSFAKNEKDIGDTQMYVYYLERAADSMIERRKIIKYLELEEACRTSQQQARYSTPTPM